MRASENFAHNRLMVDAVQLRELEEAYLSEVPPDSISYLEQFRGTILRFYLAGHSRHSTYQFLKSRNLIRCSQASFYRWLTSNVDFNREVAEHHESERQRLQGATLVSHAKPAASSGTVAAPAREAVTVPISHAKLAASATTTGTANGNTGGSGGAVTPVAEVKASGNRDESNEGQLLPENSTVPLTQPLTVEVESSSSERAKRLRALDAVLEEQSANNKEAMTARALDRLAARDGESRDP